MKNSEEASFSFLADVSAGLVSPIKTGLLSAFSNLLGDMTAIPRAWLKRPAQAVEDVTAGRSAVAAILAKNVAEEALKDPAIIQAASEIFLPSMVRKARNRVRVAQRAAEHAAMKNSNDSPAAAPEDDWMNVFVRFAEDASSDKLQDLFGRILAGQVVRPGAFSIATLRTVAELDQSVATDFTLVWAKSVGEAIDYGHEFTRGEWFARWKRLAEAGLMAPNDSAQFLPPFRPIASGNGIWAPMAVEGASLMVHFAENCSARWAHIDFTRIGCEIGSILATPDYEANMRSAGQKLARQGVARIELWSANKPVELIYPAGAT